MDRRGWLIVVAALVGAGLLAAGIAWALDDPDDGNLPRREPVGGYGPPTQAPRLAPTESIKSCPPTGPAVIEPDTGRALCGEEARKLVREDPTLGGLLRGQRYRITDFGGWFAGGSNVPLGVVGNIDIKDSIDIDAVLPYVCLGDPGKGSSRVRWTVRGVTRLHFAARFSTNRVVEVIPETTPRRRPPTGGPGTPLPGSTKCPPSKED